MTANQIAYANLRELARKNLVTESEIQRHNAEMENVGWLQAQASLSQASASHAQAAASARQAAAAESQAATAGFNAMTTREARRQEVLISQQVADFQQKAAENKTAIGWFDSVSRFATGIIGLFG